jgi:hypothetical protein
MKKIGEIQTKPKKKWYKRWWGILLIIFIFLGILGAIFDDEDSSKKSNGLKLVGVNDSGEVTSLENVNSDITPYNAMLKCYDKAKECSEGIPAVRDQFRKTCYELYYYTGNSTEILDFMGEMC